MTDPHNPASVVEDEWYRQIVEAAPDAAVVIDTYGLIILINQQTEKLFGYERKELLNQPIEVLIPQRFRGGHHIHRDGYFSEPKVREMGAGLDLYGVKKDGTEIPVEISLSQLRTKAGVFSTASIRDATSRRRAEDHFKSFLETAPDAMVIIDKTGQITLVNQQTERVFGYNRNELIGQGMEILVPESLRGRHVGHRNGYFKDPNVREMGAGLELSGRRKDGSTFPIEISLSPFDTQDGRFATAAVRDITDRKDAQIKLTEYARSLEASNRELEEFAYIASHDLQAPLRNIISFSELLREETKGKVSADADEYFDFIEEGGLRMQALIKDILEVSRVGKVDKAFERVDSAVCVNACVEALQASLNETNGKVIVGKLPMVMGDATRITQLLQNLLNNAIKFHAPNTAPVVEVSAEKQGLFWKFSIADNGIGIAADELPQVFEIFRRLHTADEYPGTGIGLSICKKIVEAHGGRIDATSILSTGTTFTFTLPDAYVSNPNE
jgi:PAS domain S-box-containing protein